MLSSTSFALSVCSGSSISSLYSSLLWSLLSRQLSNRSMYRFSRCAFCAPIGRLRSRVCFTDLPLTPPRRAYATSKSIVA